MAGTSEQSFVRRTFKNSLAGTAGGIAVCLVGHPFDTLKVRLQTQPVNKPVYSGLADCFFKTLKWEGVGGLYKGVGSPLVGQMIFRATLFTGFYQFSSLVGGPEKIGKRLNHADYFLCGSLTGFVASFAESPIDLFKTKMQIQIIRAKSGASVQYRNVFHAGYLILKGHGIRGCYQGLGATMLRDTPAFGIYFGFYELFRDMMTKPGGNVSDLSVWQVFAAGGFAGVLFWALTYPTDVIKSTLQSDELERSQRKYNGIIDCVKKMYYNEGGMKRFWRGFSPCLLRAIPANAAMLYTVERARQFLNPYI